MPERAQNPGWTPDENDKQSVLQFPNPEEWYISFLVPHIRRRLGGNFTWCAQWWKHAEAVSRIHSLWLAWEHLRNEGPLGPSTWWLHHADPHLAVLLSKDTGPFASCRPDRHSPAERLPYKRAPKGTWDSSAFSDPRCDPS